jgi:HSP20 family molecular chaperone IbpA
MQLLNRRIDPSNPFGFSELFTDFDFFSNKEKELRYPPINIIKTQGNELIIEMAVAGFSKEELSVEISLKGLVISGSHVTSHPASVSKETSTLEEHLATRSAFEYIRKHISDKPFSVEFSIPQTYDTENTHVSYIDGILKVTIPLKEGVGPKKLTIN